MNIIKIITNADFNIQEKPLSNPTIRYAARGLIFKDDKIAILYKQAKNEYKLVGGGIENGEDPELAFKREALEESGYEIKIEECLGITIEERQEANFKQISYVYIATALKDIHKLNLTKEEQIEKATLMWLSVDDALAKIKSCQNSLKPSPIKRPLDIYHSKFINKRDQEILMHCKNINHANMHNNI